MSRVRFDLAIARAWFARVTAFQGYQQLIAFRILRAQLPRLEVGRIVWPFAPVLIVSGRLGREWRKDHDDTASWLPPLAWQLGGRVVDSAGRKDQFLYGLWPLHWLIMLAMWCDHHRWDLELGLIAIGLMHGPEDGYLHEFRFGLPEWYWEGRKLIIDLDSSRKWPSVRWPGRKS